MDFNTMSNLEGCRVVVEQTAKLLYYSHIPTAAVSLLIGLFVYIKDPKKLANKLLFFVSILFSLWSFLDLVVWLNYDKNTLIMFTWSFFGIITILMFFLSLYFVYVFIDKKDISLIKKIIFGTAVLPIILLTPTRFNLTSYDILNCVAIEENYFIQYYLLLCSVIFIWIIALAFIRYRKAEKNEKKEIILLTIGIELFLFSFLFAIYLSTLLLNWGLNQYTLEQYGLFGMPIFMAFLAYLIVRYKAFNIKLLGTQALVTALVILIGAELFFADTANNQILILITLAISLGFGYILIKSVKMEVERKEQLQIMSDKLAQANDQLRKLDNAKTEFISIASHQLRTPLTAIKGFISLLLEGSYGTLKKEHQEVLNKVYTSNERLIDLVEDLLNISRIESGRMEYDFKKWDLVKMCSELVDSFVFKAKDRGLYLDFKKPASSFPEVETDGGKLREIISNLIDNALKYTPRGGVTIRLSQAGENIQVIVSDTGIGVPKEELPYLFAKFSRGKDTSRLNTGGIGLGLYVGRSMIEAIGGKIWAESDGEGKGSKFIIEMPIEKPEEK